MKSKPPALVILVPGFPKNESDTTCLPAQQSFIKTFHELYPLVNIIVLSFQYPFTASTYKWNKARVTSFGGKNKGGLSRLLLWQRVRRYFKTVQQEYNIKGLLSFWCGECALVGKSLADKYGLPHYCWLMGQDARAGNKYIRRIQPMAEELIAISDFTRNTFKHSYSIEPGHTIPLGIDERVYKKESLLRDIDILGAGSLIPLKRFDLFIQVIKELKKTMPHIKSIICGNGPEENKLRAMIIDQDLTAQVQLVGERSHMEVIGLMKRSRILLHPSSYEGFSGVCLEALGAGTQVISFTKPMEQDIPHWHIVSGPEEMIQQAISLLSSPLSYEPVIPFPMENTARAIMKLFGEQALTDR